MLEQCGRYRVLAAAGPGDALRIFVAKPNSIDLVIADASTDEIARHSMSVTMSSIKPCLPVVFIARAEGSGPASQTAPSIPAVLAEALDRILMRRRARSQAAGIG